MLLKCRDGAVGGTNGGAKFPGSRSLLNLATTKNEIPGTSVVDTWIGWKFPTKSTQLMLSIAPSSRHWRETWLCLNYEIHFLIQRAKSESGRFWISNLLFFSCSNEPVAAWQSFPRCLHQAHRRLLDGLMLLNLGIGFVAPKTILVNIRILDSWCTETRRNKSFYS